MGEGRWMFQGQEPEYITSTFADSHSYAFCVYSRYKAMQVLYEKLPGKGIRVIPGKKVAAVEQINGKCCVCGWLRVQTECAHRQ